MLALLQLIFIGHRHKYSKTLRQGNVDGPRGGLPIGYYYIKECECCGKVKMFNLTCDPLV